MHISPVKILMVCSTCFMWMVHCLAQSDKADTAKRSVAVVEGQMIYEQDLMPSLQAQLLPLEVQQYELKKQVLEKVIGQKLLEADAKRKGTTVEELLKRDVDSKVPEPSNAEIHAYYLGQKDKWNQPLDEVMDQIRESLKRAMSEQARLDYVRRLRADAKVDVLLDPPRVQVGYDSARLKGDPTAPVTVVEFSDFQCPYCREEEPILQQVLAKYGTRVKFAYRDFPLSQIHPQAELAAEASRCAGEQDKYWEYHDQLLRASSLDRHALIRYARDLKMDDKQFESCVNTGKYKAPVEKDAQDGTQAGVSGTPSFFINGIPIGGAQPKEELTKIIDEELNRKH